jgi:ribonucleoside-diphosphate reductase alpha chain
MKFDEISHDITMRQYAQPGETSVEEVLQRAAYVVRPTWDAKDEEGDSFCDLVYQLMVQKKFCPGGRILAGAGTAHGNLLNCFVQDGAPETPGTTPYAMYLARKLALVTKVGGGNGLNLDSFPPKKPFNPDGTGKVYLLHGRDDADLRTGTFLNLVTGERETKGYRCLIPKDASIPETLYQGRYHTIKVSDSTDGIWDAAAAMVRATSFGNDVLLDLSLLRPEGSAVKGSGGTSSGPASFAVEIFDNFAYWATFLGGAEYAGPVATLRYVFAPTLRVIRQGGVRRGAGMATLSIKHPDIMDFVTSKDLDREASEGDISTFNISVLVPDDFMHGVESHGSESSLFREIATHAWATGEPGLLYVDAINRQNPLFATEGRILATNPCGEIPLYPGEPCDLGAINVSEYFNGVSRKSGAYLNALSSLVRDSRRAAEYLDRILDVENPPLYEIGNAIRSKRRIGLGMMGLADALIKLGIPYNSREATEVAGHIAEAIRDGALSYSESWNQKFGRNGTPSSLQKVELNRRNIALLTVAPTGTTAMVMGTTSGIEPLFSPFIYRRVGTEYKQILHPLFKEMTEALPPTPEFMTTKPVTVTVNGEERTLYEPDGWDWGKITQAISDNHGSVQGIQGIPAQVQRVFVCAHDVSPVEHVYMQAAIQAAFDYKTDLDSGERLQTYAGNSISKTINMPNTATVDDVIRVYLLGWQEMLKGITVYRDGSRGLQVLNTSMEDDGSTSGSQAADEQLQEIVAATCSLDGSCDT